VGRWFALAAAVLSTAVFVVVRNKLDLEESRFIFAMLGCSTLAAALTLVSTFTRRPSSSLLLGLAAFILVPLLYVAYLVLAAVIVCGILGETCYS
jgi:hypothetical protein